MARGRPSSNKSKSSTTSFPLPPEVQERRQSWGRAGLIAPRRFECRYASWRLKSLAHREAKRRFGLKVIQPPGIIQKSQLRNNLTLPQIGAELIQRLLPGIERTLIHERIRRGDLRIQPVQIVGVIHPERRLDDR